MSEDDFTSVARSTALHRADVVRAAVVSDVRKRADGGRVDVVRRVWMDGDECGGGGTARRHPTTNSSGCTNGIEF